MPDVEYPSYSQDFPPLAEMPAGAEEDVTAEAQRRHTYDQRRERFESTEAMERAEQILARIGLTTATLEHAEPKNAERWRRLTGQR